MANRKKKNPAIVTDARSSDADAAAATRRSIAWKRYQGLIRQRMSEYGWNQRRLAEAAGIDPATVSRALRGDTPLALDTVERLSDALSLTDAELNRIGTEDFEFGSPEQRLRMMIVRAIIRHDLPPAKETEDIRALLDRYDDEDFAQLSYSRQQRDRVLSSLINDGYLQGSIQGIVTRRQISQRIDISPVMRIEAQINSTVLSGALRLGKLLGPVLDDVSRDMSPDLAVVTVRDLFDSLEYSLLMLADGDLWEVRMVPVYLSMLKHTYDVALGLLHHTQYLDFFGAFCQATRQQVRAAISPYQERLPRGKCLDPATAAECAAFGMLRCGVNGGPITLLIQEYFSEDQIEITPCPIGASLENFLNSVRE